VEKWNILLSRYAVKTFQAYLTTGVPEGFVGGFGVYHIHNHEFHHAMPLGILRCVYCGVPKAQKRYRASA